MRLIERIVPISFSKEVSKALKGVLALVILFHHTIQFSGLYNSINDSIVGKMFIHLNESLGYLAVGVFFFVSGYGLQYKYGGESARRSWQGGVKIV